MRRLAISAVVGLLSCDGATAFVPSGRRLGTSSVIQRCAEAVLGRELRAAGCIDFGSFAAVVVYRKLLWLPVGETRTLCPDSCSAWRGSERLMN